MVMPLRHSLIMNGKIQDSEAGLSCLYVLPTAFGTPFLLHLKNIAIHKDNAMSRTALQESYFCNTPDHSLSVLFRHIANHTRVSGIFFASHCY